MDDPVQLHYAAGDSCSALRKAIGAIAWANLAWASGHFIGSAINLVKHFMSFIGISTTSSTLTIGYGPEWYTYARSMIELIPLAIAAVAAVALLRRRFGAATWLFWCSIVMIALAIEGYVEREVTQAYASMPMDMRVSSMFWHLSHLAVPIANVLLFSGRRRNDLAREIQH